MENLKWYECVDMLLPEKRENESLEEWSERIEPYVELSESDLERGYYVRDWIMTTRKENLPWLRKENQLVDAVMNCIRTRGIRIMHRNHADDDKLVPVPERKEDESIEDWSDRISTFIHFLHKMDSWVTYHGAQPLDMSYDKNKRTTSRKCNP